MEDRTTTTSDLEGDEDTTDDSVAGSVFEGLPEETRSVEAESAGVDPDTAEAVGDAAISDDSAELEAAATAIDVSIEPVVAEPEAAPEPVVEEPAAEEPLAEGAESAVETEPAVEEPVAEVETDAAPEVAEEPATAEPEPEVEVEAAKAEAEQATESGSEEGAESEEGDEAEAATPAGPSSPYDLPGDWYVIHSYSGYENKVKVNLETRIHSMHMEGEIFDVVIPMEDVVEIKGGRKVTVPKKVFPGYILVRMYMSDDSWFGVRNTPGVTGFVGSGTKPTPLSRREVERILGVEKPEEGVEKPAPRFKPAWDVGETVRVVDGPFADFNGVIEEINLDQSKVRVLVNIFGRDTPVELNFEQIVKL